VRGKASDSSDRLLRRSICSGIQVRSNNNHYLSKSGYTLIFYLIPTVSQSLRVRGFELDREVETDHNIAVEKDTTLAAMVSNFLTSVAQRDDQERKAAVEKLKTSFKALSRDMGPRQWTRQSVDER
jgi:hypothetical protein